MYRVSSDIILLSIPTSLDAFTSLLVTSESHTVVQLVEDPRPGHTKHITDGTSSLCFKCYEDNTVRLSDDTSKRGLVYWCITLTNQTNKEYGIVHGFTCIRLCFSELDILIQETANKIC